MSDHDRRQQLHWFFSHLADGLLILMLLGFFAYAIVEWGP